MKKILLTIALVIILVVGAFSVYSIAAREDEPALNLTGANLVFGQKVHILFAADVKNVDIGNVELLIFRGDSLNVRDCVKGRESAVLRTTGATVDYGTVQGYVFEYSDLMAAEMTENIYARAYYTDGDSVYYSDTVKYSVHTYACNKLGMTGTPSTDEKLKEVLRSMLIYGADVQEYFGVNLHKLATDEYVKINLEGGTFADGLGYGLFKKGESVGVFTDAATEEKPYVTWCDTYTGTIASRGISAQISADKNKSLLVVPQETEDHEHTFATTLNYDEKHHWRASDCSHEFIIANEAHVFGGDNACIACGYKEESVHIHTYSTAWSYDEASHWNAATCEHSDEKLNLGAHTFDGVYCSVCEYARTMVLTREDMSLGGWAYGNKNPYSSTGPRIGTKAMIFVKAGTVLKYVPNGMQIFVDVVSEPGAATGERMGWFTASGEYRFANDSYVGITVAHKGGTTEVDVDDFVCDISIIPDNSNQDGAYSKRNVYRFGGEGNDWCFVYLPEDYDPDRREPYPLVIANHGNGWLMNGSAQKANWTNIGMYMSPEEIAYQPESTRSRYIPTTDQSLWYSNATIEALLAAGYIVAGAQNYGDALYGNDNCADACVDFFRHMVENYNVEEYCHMIGASNGAMTTLNASRKLGSSVKSIIIQYPLASIINQYADGKHQDGIEAAYGLDTSRTYTRSELEVLLADYDPLYYNVKDGVKEGYFPPIKIYYSLTDTTTPASANALLLIAMLNDSGIEYASVQVDSDGKNKPHGHIDHFDPAGFTEWFDSHSNSSTAPHEHTFSSKWTTNATHHWNAATCVHSDELANKGEHVFDSDGICTVCGRSDAVTLTVDDMSLGGWAYGTKNPYTYSSPRIGTTELIFVKAGTTIKYDPKGLKIFIYIVDNPGDDFGDKLGWFTKAGEYVVTRDAYVNITVSKSNGTDVIGVSDYVCEVSIIPNKKES